MAVNHDAGEEYAASIPQSLEHCIYIQHEHTLSPAAAPRPYRVSRPGGSGDIARTDSGTFDRVAPLPPHRLALRRRAFRPLEWALDRAGGADGVLCGFVGLMHARAFAAKRLGGLLAVCFRIQPFGRVRGVAGADLVWHLLWRMKSRPGMLDGRRSFPAARSSFQGHGWSHLIQVRRQVWIRSSGVK